MIVPEPRLEALACSSGLGLRAAPRTTSTSSPPGFPATPSPSVTGRALSAWESMQPFSPGVYSNFLTDAPLGRVKVAYGDHAYERLTAVMSKYDPNNFLPLQRTHSTPADDRGRMPRMRGGLASGSQAV